MGKIRACCACGRVALTSATCDTHHGRAAARGEVFGSCDRSAPWRPSEVSDCIVTGDLGSMHPRKTKRKVGVDTNPCEDRGKRKKNTQNLRVLSKQNKNTKHDNNKWGRLNQNKQLCVECFFFFLTIKCTLF